MRQAEPMLLKLASQHCDDINLFKNEACEVDVWNACKR